MPAGLRRAGWHRGASGDPIFGHRPAAVCSYAAFGTWEHRQAQEDFAATYRARSVSCDVEVEVLSIDGARRADVLLHAPGRPIAWRSKCSVAHSGATHRRPLGRRRAVIWVPIQSESVSTVVAAREDDQRRLSIVQS
jgi:hypothetical protein